MNRCGCNPIPEPFEFPATVILFDNNNKSYKPVVPTDESITKLKDKVIKEYLCILDNLECGIQNDLEKLLEYISQIYIYEKLSIEIPEPNTTYIGFALEETIEELNLQLLYPQILYSIEMTKTIENTLLGSHLWIVSPYVLHKVSINQGFASEVKMVSIGVKDGLHYYRSNSKLDLCTLTYYIS